MKIIIVIIASTSNHVKMYSAVKIASLISSDISYIMFLLSLYDKNGNICIYEINVITSACFKLIKKF